MKRLFRYFELNMLIVIIRLLCVPFTHSVSHNFDIGGLINLCVFAVSCR